MVWNAQLVLGRNYGAISGKYHRRACFLKKKGGVWGEKGDSDRKQRDWRVEAGFGSDYKRGVRDWANNEINKVVLSF